MYSWIVPGLFFVIHSSVVSAGQNKLQGQTTSNSTGFCEVRYRWQIFNFTTHYCCTGNPGSIKSKSTRKHACCNVLLRNTTKVTCCNTRRVSVKHLKKATCCGNDFYNVDLEFCVNKSIYSIHTSKKNFLTSTPTLKLKIEEQFTDDTTNFNIVCKIIILCSLFLVAAFISPVATVLKIKQSRFCPTYKFLLASRSAENYQMEKKEERFAGMDSECMMASTPLPDLLETDCFENDELLKKKDFSNNVDDKMQAADLKIGHESFVSDKPTQTEDAKDINIKNMMGQPFDKKHVFDKNNKSLVLPYSTAKLTLSKEDVSDGPIECYASTYRNLKQIYGTLQKYLKQGDEIVSPTLEYFFPRNKTFLKFACVEMDFYNCGCNQGLDVWRFESDAKQMVKIPSKDSIDTEKVNAFYEIVLPNKVRIYLKRFCILVCTVCHQEHKSLTLTAYPFTVSLPSNTAMKHIRVTLYILACVSQLQDYAHGISERVNADKQHIKIERNINLPMRVQLEDDLAIRLTILDDAKGFWQQITYDDELDACDKVQLHNIVSCPIYHSKGSPYHKEWHFQVDPNLVDGNKATIVFKCAFSLAIEYPHPGVDTRQPPRTKFSLVHEVDISDVKKLGQSQGGVGLQHLAETPQQAFQLQQNARTNVSQTTDERTRMSQVENRTIGAQGNLNVRQGPTAVAVRSERRFSDAGSNSFFQTEPVEKGQIVPSPTERYLQHPAQCGARPKEHRQTHYNRNDEERKPHNAFATKLAFDTGEHPTNQRTNAATIVRAETSEESLCKDQAGSNSGPSF